VAGKDIIGKILWLKKHERKSSPQLITISTERFCHFSADRQLLKSVDLAVVCWLMDTVAAATNGINGFVKWPALKLTNCPRCGKARQSPEHYSRAARRPPSTRPRLSPEPATSSHQPSSGAIKNGELHVRIGTSGGVAGHFTKRKIDLAHSAGCIGSASPQKYYLGIGTQDTMGICLEWVKNKVLYHGEKLRDEYKVEKLYRILDVLVSRVKPGADGLIFTPWMAGERCPLNDDTLRGGLYKLD
jgi:xylulokinase